MHELDWAPLSDFLKPESVFALGAFITSIVLIIVSIRQLHIQRVHNAKSVKPIGQIIFKDRLDIISVCISNDGMGPMIITQLTFRKAGKTYSEINPCVPLDPRTFWHEKIDLNHSKTILPKDHFKVFEANWEQKNEDHPEKILVRQMLIPIELEVSYHDIYDNEFTVTRKLDWFSRQGKTLIHPLPPPTSSSPPPTELTDTGDEMNIPRKSK